MIKIDKGKNLVVLTLVFIATMGLFGNTYAASKSEAQSFIDYFKKSNRSDVSSIVENLYWSGVTDVALYDMIEAELKSNYRQDSKAAMEINSWLVKSLAVSGNKKYLKTMEEIQATSESKKLRKHAATATEMLDNYMVWVPIMNKGVANLPVEKRGEKRVRNMLESDNPELLRIGAKRVYHQYIGSTSLVALVEKSLLSKHNKSDEKVHVDAMAWLIKVLAESKDSKYKVSIEQVAAETDNKKIRKYAVKYAEYL